MKDADTGNPKQFGDDVPLKSKKKLEHERKSKKKR